MPHNRGSPDRYVHDNATSSSGGGGASGDVFVTNTSSDPVPVSVIGNVTVNEPVTVDGTVEITNDVGNPIPVSGTVSVNEPVTVDGTVALDAVSLAALETVTVNQGTSPWVVSGTVTVNEPVTVDATDLDIRDLDFATDSIDVSGSEISLDAASLAALETVTVNQGTSPWVISGTVSVNEPVTVDATDLDIRDLTFATDSVDVSGSEVSLDSATLTALETITVNQGTSPWVVSGTVTVNEPVSVDDNGGSLTVDNPVLTDVHDDPNDAIRVNIVAGAAGGVSATDDSAFAVGTDDVVPMGALFDDTSTDSVDEGDVGIPRMTADRRLIVADGGGVLTVDGTVTIGTLPTFGATQGIYAEDSVHASGDLGQFVLGLVSAAVSDVAGTGDYAPFIVDTRGAQYTVPRVEGTHQYVVIPSGSQPALFPTLPVNGEVFTASTSLIGSVPSDIKVAHLDMTTATTTTIVASVTNRKIRVLSYQISCNEATSTDINFARGAGTTRVTGSAVHSFNARGQNTNVVAANGAFLFETAATENLRVTQTGATDISISVVYIEVE